MSKILKIIITAIFFIVIAFGIYFFLIPQSTNITSEIFLIKDTSEIAKVLIIQNSEKVTLSRTHSEGTWIVDNKYPANKKAIKMLFQTLTEAKINKPVLISENDSTVKYLQSEGKIIEIYTFDNKLIKKIIVGSYNKEYEGTYMMNVENNIPFIVNIPGVENNLNYRYNINALYWLKPEIFSYNPNEIKAIILKYPNNNAKSFRLEVFPDTAKIFNFQDNKYITNINLQKVGSYLSYFMNVKFASETTDTKKIRNKLLKEIPFADITVETGNNKIKNVKLFKIENDSTNNFDMNKLRAIINNQDVVIVKYYDFDLILKDINYFAN